MSIDWTPMKQYVRYKESRNGVRNLKAANIMQNNSKEKHSNQIILSEKNNKKT